MKKISFVVYYPYQWFIYRNIYRQIPADKREVIVDLSDNPGLQDEEVRMSIASLLQRESVPFRVLEKVICFNRKLLQDFFTDVEVIVSCWENGCVSNNALRHIKKVNVTYGIAKELTMLRPTRSIYDVILAYGARDQRYFELLTKSIAIGNPRLDNYYRGIADDSIREKLSRYFKDKKKKTILYVPTHGDLGSFHEMLPTFARISRQYNIIFKPHYYTLREEKEIIEKYRQIESLLVIDDTWDTIEVMSVSDIIVSDNSSAIFDAMQIDKPLIVCDFLDNQFIDTIHKKIRLAKKGTGILTALTYSDSLEQEIKRGGLAMTIKKPNDIDDLLENIDDTDGRYRDFRKEIVAANFKYVDGHSSERAVEIILRIYGTKRTHVPGILHHAYLAYNNRAYQWSIESEHKETVLTTVPSTTIVWIFCELRQKNDEIICTIYSALNEKEVTTVCVSGSVGKDVRDTLSRSEFSDRIIFFENHADGINLVYSRLGICDNLLVVKANTIIKDLNTICNFKVSCKRDMIFFSENIVPFPENWVSRLFYQLKYEMLGFRSLAMNTLLSIPYELICASEKCAVLIDSKALLAVSPRPVVDTFIFEWVLSSFINIDSLKSQGRDFYGTLCDDYILMPNFFMNGSRSANADIINKLVAKGLILNALGIPIKRWPDKKIGKLLWKIATGDFRRYQLLKLILLKVLTVKKQVFLSKARSFLEKVYADDAP